MTDDPKRLTRLFRGFALKIEEWNKEPLDYVGGFSIAADPFPIFNGTPQMKIPAFLSLHDDWAVNARVHFKSNRLLMTFVEEEVSVKAACRLAVLLDQVERKKFGTVHPRSKVID